MTQQQLQNRIELTTAHIIEGSGPLGGSSVPPSVAGGIEPRNLGKAAQNRGEVPIERPLAAIGGDAARIEAFLVKKWCYRIYRQALRSGRLVPGPCFADGPDCRGRKGNGHHHDYRYPHDVVWCCASHHAALDKLRRDGRTLASAMVAVLVLEGRANVAA